MTIYIQLTIAGENVGPFDLYSDTDLVNPFESGVLRQTLVDGYLTTAPDGTTQVKVVSTGECNVFIIIPLGVPTTTTTSTSTTTTTTTAAPTTTTTTTVDPNIYFVITECTSGELFIAAKETYSLGDKVKFQMVPSDGNVYCGDVSGTTSDLPFANIITVYNYEDCNEDPSCDEFIGEITTTTTTTVL